MSTKQCDRPRDSALWPKWVPLRVAKCAIGDRSNGDPRLCGCFSSGRLCSSFRLIPRCTKTDANAGAVVRYEFNPCCSNARRIARSSAAVMPAASRATISSFSAADLLKSGLSLGKAYARATAVLVDELYSAYLKHRRPLCLAVRRELLPPDRTGPEADTRQFRESCRTIQERLWHFEFETIPSALTGDLMS